VLIRNHRQELLCRAWILAVAARCGLGINFRELDYGIDITLHSISRRGSRAVESGFKLDIQAKSTSLLNLSSSDVVYDLEVKAYNDLRETEVGCPRILVLLLLPDEEHDWTTHTEEQMILRQAAYWISLRGMPLRDNLRSVRVTLPRSQLLTPTALTSIMDRLHRREQL
jgi:hypothetical protein